jgi:predicted nuclease of predicted toxin-antitoxin system
MNFFLDANIPYAVLEMFKECKLEAVHARDVGMARAADKEIAAYATRERSILITKDLEFANRLLFPPESHFGVIIVRYPSTFTAARFAKALKEFIASVDATLLDGAATIVKLGTYRMRKL